MQADFSRWTFDGHAGFRSVLLQQGRVLLDADWNEQTQITAQHDEVRTRDSVGRSGAPVDDAAFGLVDGTGAAPAGTPWADLRLTPGRFYVDGVLVTVAAPGAALSDQPYLPAGPGLPGLPEEGADGRYALVLEAFSHHVTADEAPRLRESALGGPDTTTRERTVWQVRIVAVDDGQLCAGAHPWLDYSAPTMTAALEDVPPGSDPCRITSARGYRRLENQLYRVEIYTTGSGGTEYLWSRENASVVAALLEIGTTVVTGMDAELRLDREGRDEELSIQEGDIVEVTSVDRQLHGLPGFLAVAGAPDGLRLPVNWSGAVPPGLTELGEVPLVRRWEGGPTATSATAVTLEDGIQVSFGTGDFRVGDHWLIPARTVRLVYGATALAGTIEWPVAGGVPQPQPPLGPVRHRVTLALVERTTVGGEGRWSLVSDCRRLFPPLTQMVTLDLLGGDGQEALPGDPLPHPVRVAVRNGALPVAAATVRFTTTADHLAEGIPGAGDPAELTVDTDAGGQAEVRWLLGSGRPTTHTMTARLLDDADNETGAEVRVTGHRTIAAETAYDPAECAEMAAAGIDNVQDALDHLCARRTAFPGTHVEDVFTLIGNQPLENDTLVEVGRLLEGFGIVLDDVVDEIWLKGKPVLTLTLELPWPTGSDREVWDDQLVGTQTVTLDAELGVQDERVLIWRPSGRVPVFLRRLPERMEEFDVARVLANITLRGNVVASRRDRYINGLALSKLRPDGSTALVYPTVDDVHAADFRLWFWITGQQSLRPKLFVPVQALLFGFGRQTLPLAVHNTGGAPLRVDAEARTTSPAGGRLFTVEPDVREIAPGESFAFAVTSVQGGQVTGELLLKSNDPDTPNVVVRLTARTIGIAPTPDGVLRLKAPSEEIVDPERGARRLRAALAKREQEPALRVAVAPGFEDDVEVLRRRLADDRVELSVVAGDPADLVARAAAGELVVDAVIGGEDVARALGDAVLPILERPEG